MVTREANATKGGQNQGRMQPQMWSERATVRPTQPNPEYTVSTPNGDRRTVRGREEVPHLGQVQDVLSA